MSQACPDCGVAVAENQRYCISCGAGLRAGPQSAAAEAEAGQRTAEPSAPNQRGAEHPKPLVLTLRLRGRTGIVRLPSQRVSAVLAAGVLASGVLIGIAVGPVALGSTAAAAARRIIALVGGPPTSPKAAAGTTTSVTSSDSGGGGGAGSLLGGPSSTPVQPAAAPASTAPASASPPAAAATTTTSTSTTSTIAVPAKLNATGVVLAADFASQSFDAVDPKHRLVEVHAASTLPSVRTRVRFARTSLANGTESASRTVTVRGARPSTVIADGVVSYVNSANASYVLSARGVSLPIDTAATPVPKSPASDAPLTSTPTPLPAPPASLPGVLAGLVNSVLPPPATPPSTPASPVSPAAAPLPTVGQRLEVTLSLPVAAVANASATSLREVSRTTLGQAKGPLDLAGVITAIDKQKRVATISADGPGLSSYTIPLSVPPSISLHGLSLPATVVAHANVAAGVYMLTGLAPDASTSAAADRSKYLGDLRGGIRGSSARFPSPRPTASSRHGGSIHQVRPDHAGSTRKGSGERKAR